MTTQFSPSPAATPTQPSPVVRFLKRRWLTIVLIVLAAVFIAQNRTRTSVDLFWMTVSAPLWLILTVLFLVGLIAGAVTFRRRREPKVATKR